MDGRLRKIEDKNQHQERWLNQVASQIDENQQHQENWIKLLASQVNELKEANCYCHPKKTKS